MNLGGSELGAIRHEITPDEITGIAQRIREWDIRGIIAGGWLGPYLNV